MSFLSRIFGAPSARTPHITCAEYKARFKEGKEAHLLLDVRTADEYRSGFIPGSVNVSLQDLMQNLAKIPKDRPVVIYCRSGNRSATAAQMLAQAGYSDLHDLGGIIHWASSGYPVKR
jgi:rhodanese-related sulfurtransferase